MTDETKAAQAAEMLATLERMKEGVKAAGGKGLVEVQWSPDLWVARWLARRGIRTVFYHVAEARTAPEAVAACWAKGAK